MSTSVPSANSVLVPETLLKKRKSTEKSRQEKAAKAVEQRKVRKASRQALFKRAELYVNQQRAKEREAIRLRRLAKSQGEYHVPDQPKVYFVVRLRGINNIAPKPRKILQLLRLLQINNGVFIKVSKATTQMLQFVQPYVTYGEPNLKTVRELVLKRGYGRINKQRIPLTDNQIVEKSLGKFGIVSVEDIIHEISTVGPNFKQVAAFLWPFKLSNPTGGFKRRKFNHFVEGGATGDREENINKLVRQMN